MPGRLLQLLLMALACWSWRVEARSAVADDTRAVDAPRVGVVLVGEFGADPEIAAVIGEWLGRSGLAPEVTRAPRLELADLRSPGPAGVPVRLWLVRGDERHARVYLAEPRAGRYLVRNVPMPPGLDEVGRERIALVVLSSALAFLEGGATSSLDEVTRSLGPPAPPISARDGAAPEPPKPSPTHPAPPTGLGARRTTDLGVGFFYAITNQTPAGLATGPGLRTELLRTRDRYRAGAYLELDYQIPHRAYTERLVIELRSFALGTGLAGGIALGKHLAWQVALGGGLEIVDAAPTARDGSVAWVEADRTSLPFLRFAVGPVWRWSTALMALTTRVDVEPVGLRYELSSGSARQTELEMPRVRPGVALTFGGSRSVFARRATASEAAPVPGGTRSDGGASNPVTIRSP
ncbi:MAG: hypothetical protein JW751_31770 [Polyangiaceae bacterium]|nr:hypothetical protein [Polyangiaceae bacterium]